MKPWAYYSEIDEYAAQWLRNLIDAGHIAPGIVDTRDMRDVTPDDLREFTQCHFFAGIGVWSHALRRSGWSDDRPIWTGSCPCQPFSAAGKGEGFDDERHLWPHWHWLIEQCRPPLVIGEQVASKDGLGWLDLIQADLAGTGYASRAVDICAAGLGVEWESSQAGEWLRRAVRDCADPGVATMLRDFADWAGAGNIGEGGHHIRQRLYFVGVADCDEQQQHRSGLGGARRRAEHPDDSPTHRLPNPNGRECDGLPISEGCKPNGPPSGWFESDGGARSGSPTHRLDHHHHQGSQRYAGDGGDALGQRQGAERPASEAGVSDGMEYREGDGRLERGTEPGERGAAPPIREFHDAEYIAQSRSGIECRPHAPDSGRNPVDWLFCRDGKWRATQSGSQPLAHAVAARVGKLRAYGNALDAETATEFCRAVRETVDGSPVRSSGSVDFEDILG